MDVDVVVGMLATIEDVEHRDGQGVAVARRELLEQRYRAFLGVRARHGQGRTEYGVRAQAALVVSAVKLGQPAVDRPLVPGIHTSERTVDLRINVGDSGQHTLAPVALWIVVPQFDRFVDPGGGSRRDFGGCGAAGLQFAGCLQGGIASRI